MIAVGVVLVLPSGKLVRVVAVVDGVATLVYVRRGSASTGDVELRVEWLERNAEVRNAGSD